MSPLLALARLLRRTMVSLVPPRLQLLLVLLRQELRLVFLTLPLLLRRLPWAVTRQLRQVRLLPRLLMQPLLLANRVRLGWLHRLPRQQLRLVWRRQHPARMRWCDAHP